MYQRLQQCAKIPDFNNYLAFILTQGEGTQDEIRQTAGLLLKNNLKMAGRAPSPRTRRTSSARSSRPSGTPTGSSGTPSGPRCP